MADRGMLELFRPWWGKVQAMAESVVSNVTTSRTLGGECTYRVGQWSGNGGVTRHKTSSISIFFWRFQPFGRRYQRVRV